MLVSGFLHNDVAAQMLAGVSYSIFCTSNHDGTGICSRVDNNEQINCEMIPGMLINCKEPNQNTIQCVSYGSVVESQSYFYCTRRSDPGVRKDRINTNRFERTKSSSSGGGSEVLTDSLGSEFVDTLN